MYKRLTRVDLTPMECLMKLNLPVEPIRYGNHVIKQLKTRAAIYCSFTVIMVIEDSAAKPKPSKDKVPNGWLL